MYKKILHTFRLFLPNAQIPLLPDPSHPSYVVRRLPSEKAFFADDLEFSELQMCVLCESRQTLSELRWVTPISAGTLIADSGPSNDFG